MSERTPWLPYRRPVASARYRLFCFPHAGGGAALFRDWPRLLGDGVEVCAVELPGRGARLREPPAHDLLALARTAAEALDPWLDPPHVFFGHSLGALLAFEIARGRRRAGSRLPALFVASGANAPHRPRTKRERRHLPDADFLDELRAMGGTPEAVLREPELMRFLLPMLRADFGLSETYVHHAEPPLPLPLLLCGAKDDEEVPTESLLAWKDVVTGPANEAWFDGGHFFLRERAAELCDVVRRESETSVEQDG